MEFNKFYILYLFNSSNFVYMFAKLSKVFKIVWIDKQN